MRLHTQDFDNNIDWNKDDDNFDDIAESLRDFRVFDPIAEEIEIREYLKSSSRVLKEDLSA